MYICIYICSFTNWKPSSVPFARPRARLKLAGLSPAKFPAESPAKKNAPQKFKLGLPNSS